MILDEKIKLYNGVEIPKLGFGTWLIDNDKAPLAVKTAIEVGYRHIDTAEAYGNEEGVGLGIKESKIKREDIFIQTKLRAEAKTYLDAKKEIELSFKKLGVDYIDLMIIHSPQPWINFRDGKHYENGNLEAWKALTEYYEAGKIRAIGVSNFEIIDLKNIMNNSKVKPMVNQILCHISNTDFELIKFCHDNDIVVEAYSPIAHGELLNNEVLKNMAKKYNATIPELCIRYTLQLNLVSLPKASTKEHMIDNANVNFIISDEDMAYLCSLDKISDYGDSMIFPCYNKQVNN